MVTTVPHDDDLDEVGTREPTMTLPRWRRFVGTQPASFTLMSDQQWTGLDDLARDSYDDSRISYHSEMVIIATSLVRQVARQGQLLTLLNRRETGARRMLILSGLQTTGKTTARAAAAEKVPGAERRPHSGRLRLRATQRVSAQARRGVRPVPVPAANQAVLQHQRRHRRRLRDPHTIAD